MAHFQTQVRLGRRTPPRQKLIKWFLRWSIPTILTAGLLIVPSYFWAKRQWSLKWLKEAETFHAEEKYAEAFQKSMSAHTWNPYNEDVLLSLARNASKIGHPASVDWWLAALEKTTLSEDDLLLFFQTAFKHGRHEVAHAHMGAYQDKLPSVKETWQMQITVLRAQQQYIEALQLIEHLLQEGADDWFLHESKVNQLLQFPRLEYRRKAIDHLLQVAQSDNQNALQSIRWLLKHFPSELTSDERANLFSQLTQHPMSQREENLLAAAERYRQKKISFETFGQQLLNTFNLKKEEDLLFVSEWLSALGLHDMVIRLFPNENIIGTNKALFSRLLEARLAENKWQEAYDMTQRQGKQNPLSPLENLFARARALKLSNDEAAYQEALALAVKVAAPEEFPFAEQQLFMMKEWPSLIKVYERYLDDLRLAPLGKSKLLLIHYALGHEHRVMNMMPKTSITDYEQDPTFQLFVSYLDLIFDNNITEARQTIEAIVADQPSYFEHRVLLAFAHLKSGQAELAKSLLNDIPQDEIQSNHKRYINIAWVAIQASVGNQEGLSSIIERCRSGPLLGKEQEMLMKVGAAKYTQ